MRLARLAKRKYATLDGEGAKISGGRWNSPGTAVAYTGSCSALCALEYLAHSSVMPSGLTLMLIEVPETLEIERISDAPADIGASRQIGDEWAASKATALLEVPSVLVPRQRNYLINPAHKLFGAIRVVDRAGFAFDSRLLSSIPPI
jgi:RES domain-containing protein